MDVSCLAVIAVPFSVPPSCPLPLFLTLLLSSHSLSLLFVWGKECLYKELKSRLKLLLMDREDMQPPRIYTTSSTPPFSSARNINCSDHMVPSVVFL